jgi:signal transduction histidine kinase
MFLHLSKENYAKRQKPKHHIKILQSRLSILNTISTAVSGALDLNEMLHVTIDIIMENLRPDSVRIYLLNEERTHLNLAGHRGLPMEFIDKIQGRRRQVGDGDLGKAILAYRAFSVDNNSRSSPVYSQAFAAEGLHSTLFIPMFSKYTPVGVLCLSSRANIDFSADDLDFFTLIGTHIGMAAENARLYDRVITSYKDLKVAHEQILRNEKMASLGRLAASIAHEINNPLAAVLTYIRLMTKLLKNKRFTPQRLDDIARYLSIMESETARSGEIVKGLLAFSRSTGTRIEPQQIDAVIEKTLTLIAHSLELKGIRVDRHIGTELPLVPCDFRQIQQALLNLMINALDFMSQGGVLSIGARHLEDEKAVEITVADTGSGIPEKNLKQVFEPFFTTKEEGKGVGLGLAVVYGIVTGHGGTISVDSRPGQGTVFCLKLPTAPPSADGHAEKPKALNFQETAHGQNGTHSYR